MIVVGTLFGSEGNLVRTVMSEYSNERKEDVCGDVIRGTSMHI